MANETKKIMRNIIALSCIITVMANMAFGTSIVRETELLRTGLTYVTFSSLASDMEFQIVVPDDKKAVNVSSPQKDGWSWSEGDANCGSDHLFSYSSGSLRAPAEAFTDHVTGNVELCFGDGGSGGESNNEFDYQLMAGYVKLVPQKYITYVGENNYISAYNMSSSGEAYGNPIDMNEWEIFGEGVISQTENGSPLLVGHDPLPGVHLSSNISGVIQVAASPGGDSPNVVTDDVENVDVVSIEPNSGYLVDDGDDNNKTKLYVLKKAADGNISVDVTLHPDVSDNLPAGWSINGGEVQNSLSTFIDKSTPSVTEVTFSYAGVDSGYKTTIHIINLKSETTALAPANKTRTKLGVGEEVELTFEPASLTPDSWSISGNGSLDSETGKTNIYTAHERAGNTTVTTTYKGIDVDIMFDVIEPSGLNYVQKPGTNVRHVHGKASVGFQAIIYVLPNDVSFENIQIREGVAIGVGVGFYSDLNGVMHRLGDWSEINANFLNPDKPNIMTGEDTINAGDKNPPFSNGIFVWDIPYQFRVNGGDPKEFDVIEHRQEADDTGKVILKKGNLEKSKEANDPTSTY